MPCTIKALTEVHPRATAHHQLGASTALPASRPCLCASPLLPLPRPDPRLWPPPQAVNANPLDDQLKLFGSEMGNVRGRVLRGVGTTLA